MPTQHGQTLIKVYPLSHLHNLQHIEVLFPWKLLLVILSGGLFWVYESDGSHLNLQYYELTILCRIEHSNLKEIDKQKILFLVS